MLLEFRTNGNWDCNVPVHPKLSLHKPQPDYFDVSKHDLGKFLLLLFMEYHLHNMYVYVYIPQILWISILKQKTLVL